MNTTTVLYSFVGRVVTQNGARLTAMGRIRGPHGAPFSLYELAADATEKLIGHRPDPRTGVALNRMHGVDFLDAIDEAISAACEIWNVTKDQLYSRSRTDHVCEPRFVLYRYLCRNCGLSTTEAGKLLRRDHGSVVHGINQIDAWEAQSATIRAKVAEFTRRIGRNAYGEIHE